MRCCEIQGCAQQYYAKGLCKRHYQQMKTYGQIVGNPATSRRDPNEFSFDADLNCWRIHILDIWGNPKGIALIDEQDLEKAKPHKWKIGTNGYVGSMTAKCLLHHFILNIQPSMKVQVDHANGNKLDCRRGNLRLATNGENQMNRRKSLGFSSQYKGVFWNSRAGKWASRIVFEGKSIHLGFYLEEIDAAKVYDKAARKYFKTFARVNFEHPKKGKPLSESHRKKLSERVVTEEWRQRMSEGQKRRHEKYGHPQLGKKRSEEAKQSMSEAWERKKAKGLMIGENHPLTKRMDSRLKDGPWLYEQYLVMGSNRLGKLLGCSGRTILNRLIKFGYDRAQNCNHLSYASQEGKKQKMIFIAVLMILALPFSAFCAPFLVSDPPSDQVETCTFDGLDLSCDLAADGSIHTDLAALPPGSYTMRAKYCTEKGLWCSDWSNPFSFAKPALIPPAAIGLSR